MVREGQGHLPPSSHLPLGVQNPPARLQARTFLPWESFGSSKHLSPLLSSVMQHDPELGLGF